jgi:hypothetical protein
MGRWVNRLDELVGPAACCCILGRKRERRAIRKDGEREREKGWVVLNFEVFMILKTKNIN